MPHAEHCWYKNKALNHKMALVKRTARHLAASMLLLPCTCWLHATPTHRLGSEEIILSHLADTTKGFTCIRGWSGIMLQHTGSARVHQSVLQSDTTAVVRLPCWIAAADCCKLR